ncbi:MAG: transglutaminase-like domain-containing protein [Planctomycetota bacterium]
MTSQPNKRFAVAAEAGADGGVEAVPVAAVKSSYTRKSEAKATVEIREELERRRVGVLLLAAPALVALIVFRLQYVIVVVLAIEYVTSVALLLLTTGLLTRLWSAEGRNESAAVSPWALAAATASALSPWGLEWIYAAGNGNEILMLASLGWTALWIASLANTFRTLGISVVASGFLLLFACFISEFDGAVLFAYVWVAICLWWLLSNHWTAVECVTAERVERSPVARWVYLAAASLVFILATGAVWDRIPVLRKLRAEVMRTSGGTSQRDSSARSGVGDGDALIAARRHATSFGAVETDVFLDSPKPSLFDVFSDEFGFPKKKNRVERAQALAPNDADVERGRYSEANRSGGGGEFSIERDRPKQRKRLEDLYADSLMYWEGATGTRLAVQRLERFDGLKWVAAELEESEKPKEFAIEGIVIDERTWFRPSGTRIQGAVSPFVGSVPESLRFTRFRSPAIPTRAGLQLWSIDRITMSDFFGYTANSCLYMPGRKNVPDYTVVRFVGSQIEEERVEKLLKNGRSTHSHGTIEEESQKEIEDLAQRYAGSTQRGWQQVEAVIDGLRSDFEYARDQHDGDAGAVTVFLEKRSGPSYLFATAAALMLDHLGYETRLATGFYTSPSHYDVRERATAILPQDAHTWLEVHAGRGYWIPLEPTPGFAKPRFRASWLYLARKHWRELAFGGSLIALFAAIVYFARRQLFMLWCRMLQPVLGVLGQRQQLAWLSWMLDMRWKLIGAQRNRSETQRRCFSRSDWGLDGRQTDLMMNFLNVFDVLRFGRATDGSVIEAPGLSVMIPLIHQIRSIKNEINHDRVVHE